MARYHGRKGQVYMSTTGTGDAVAVIGLSEWSIDRSTAKEDVTAFGDANIQRVPGLPDTQGSYSGFWDDTSDTLFDAADSADGVQMYLYPDAENRPLSYWHGPAWVDMSQSTGVSSAVAVSGSFVANGDWAWVNG